MTRKEYELVFQAIKSYRVYMTPDEEALSEKILDDLFYVPLIDKLSTDDDFENDFINKSPLHYKLLEISYQMSAHQSQDLHLLDYALQ